MTDTLKIGKIELTSRLIIGSGKYRTLEQMAEVITASGTDMITVAIGRVNLEDRSQKNILDGIDRNRTWILPNTAGAYTAEDAVRIARLSRAAGIGEIVKLEVIGDKKNLMPDTV